MSGKKIWLECGHEGEIVVGDFAVCLEGCEEAIPEYIKPEKTEPIECIHVVRYHMFGVAFCRLCGKRI